MVAHRQRRPPPNGGRTRESPVAVVLGLTRYRSSTAFHHLLSDSYDELRLPGRDENSFCSKETMKSLSDCGSPRQFWWADQLSASVRLSSELSRSSQFASRACTCPPPNPRWPLSPRSRESTSLAGEHDALTLSKVLTCDCSGEIAQPQHVHALADLLRQLHQLMEVRVKCHSSASTSAYQHRWTSYGLDRDAPT